MILRLNRLKVLDYEVQLILGVREKISIGGICDGIGVRCVHGWLIYDVVDWVFVRLQISLLFFN